jgi:predicted nucleic acid-binding protein
MSRIRVLDTNRLIAHWRRSRKKPLSSYSRADVMKWADELIRLDGTNAVLTPVVIEFLCGARDQLELTLYRAFLDRLEVIDGGAISSADWETAKRFAAWIPRDGTPRDFADCLIMAISRRLGYELLTSDLDLSRRR